MKKQKDMIETKIKNYVNGYLNADHKVISKVFHSETKLYCINDKKIEITEMPSWIKNIQDRNINGDIRKAKLKIKKIDITKNTAMAKIELQFDSFTFTDYLSFLNVDRDWIIIGKIYTKTTHQGISPTQIT